MTEINVDKANAVMDRLCDLVDAEFIPQEIKPEEVFAGLIGLAASLAHDNGVTKEQYLAAVGASWDLINSECALYPNGRPNLDS